MASSFSLTSSSSYEGRYMTLSCTQTKNISDNTSTINWTLTVAGGTAVYYGTGPTTVTINGTTVYSKSRVAWENKTFPAAKGSVSGSLTVSHNSDGAKSISVSLSTAIYTFTVTTNSDTWTLDPIPRASSFSLSASSVNVGNNITVNISRASSSFTHHVKIWVSGHEGEENYTTKVTGVGTSATFSIPTTWYNAMPSSTSCTAYCRVATYNGSTWIGNSDTKAFTVTVPSSIVPTIGTITLTPATINGNSILVQGKNKLTVSVSDCSAGTGSNIKSYTFSGPGISSTTTSTSVSAGPISSTGTLTYTVTVTDNRERTASKSATIKCYEYSAPYFKSFNAYRSNSNGTTDNSGTYAKCSYDLGFSSVNSTNNVTVKIYYKKNSATSYSSVSSLTDSTETSGSNILSSIALDSTYTVYATITDNYSGSSSSQTITIFGAARVLNITSDGTGIAFGKIAESTQLLESRYKVKAPGLTSTRGTRPTDANIASETDYTGCVEYYLASNSMTSNKPSLGDGHILHFHWDGTNGYDSQLYLHNSDGAIMSRGCNGGTWGNWNAVQYKPTTLYSTSTGNIGTITLSSSAANFTYLEIFYTDNNTRQPSSIKVYSPNGKYVSLSCIEPSTSGSEPRAYIRTSGWTISGTTMTPGRSDLSSANRGVYAQIYPHASGTNIDVNVTAQNYIKIFRVLGYA